MKVKTRKRVKKMDGLDFGSMFIWLKSRYREEKKVAEKKLNRDGTGLVDRCVARAKATAFKETIDWWFK